METQSLQGKVYPRGWGEAQGLDTTEISLLYHCGMVMSYTLAVILGAWYRVERDKFMHRHRGLSWGLLRIKAIFIWTLDYRQTHLSQKGCLLTHVGEKFMGSAFRQGWIQQHK